MNEVRKQVIAINGASTTAGATATGVIDTLGFSYAEIDVITTTSDNTTNNPSVLKVAYCDTSNGTFTDITSCVGDGTGGFTVPAALTEGNWGVKFCIDLRAKPYRWLQVSASPLATQVISAIANLGRGKTGADSSTDAGTKALVFG